jgi:hypothetical protein
VSEQIPNGERYICTADAPWDPTKGRRACHPDAVKTYSGDYYDEYQCPHCGHVWTQELPE